eukprot:scaffold96603_cov44-Attheya_sp.AAC.1
MMKFAEGMFKVEKSTKHSKRFNLTTYQNTVLKELKADQPFFIWQADKNLGPCIIERRRYIKRCFSDHLTHNETTYKQLSKIDAEEVASDTEFALKDLIEEHYDDLAPWEKDYFNRSYDLEYRMPQFYLTAKVHKKPWST